MMAANDRLRAWEVGMKRRVMKRFHPPGTEAGTLPAPVAAAAGPVALSLITFAAGAYEERRLARLDEVPESFPAGIRAWLRVCGHDAALLNEIAWRFGVHALVLEDVLNVGQRPKVEDYGTHLFVIVDTVRRADGTYYEEQVSLLLFENLLISVQERESDLFRPIEERLRTGRGRARAMGLDHLTYSLIDTVVDHYFPVLEQLNDRLEDVENGLLDTPDPEDLQLLHSLKRDLMRLRKATWPLREMIASLGRGDSHLMGPDTRLYLRDVLDHTVQIMEMIDACRDTATSLTDLYISSLSNRLNGIMKVLTVIATIFMPLTFLAGIWGMNFNTHAGPLNMPELNWAWGYPFALALMAAVSVAMVVAFKRRGWF
jgi:magnesium transporter